MGHFQGKLPPNFTAVRWGEGGFGGLVAPMTTFPDINVLYNAAVVLRALHAEDDGLICPEVGGWGKTSIVSWHCMTNCSRQA
jgi:hypothetical protein